MLQPINQKDGGRERYTRRRVSRSAVRAAKHQKSSNEAIKCHKINEVTQKTNPNEATKSFRIVVARKNEAKTNPLSALDRDVG
jgi:hypothetical protein